MEPEGPRPTVRPTGSRDAGLVWLNDWLSHRVARYLWKGPGQSRLPPQVRPRAEGRRSWRPGGVSAEAEARRGRTRTRTRLPSPPRGAACAGRGAARGPPLWRRRDACAPCAPCAPRRGQVPAPLRLPGATDDFRGALSRHLPARTTGGSALGAGASSWPEPWLSLSQPSVLGRPLWFGSSRALRIHSGKGGPDTGALGDEF